MGLRSRISKVFTCSLFLVSGTIFGGLACTIVNEILLRVSETPGVSCTIGLMLFGIAVVISCRAPRKGSRSQRYFVLAFALWVLFAAVFCMILDKQFVHWITPTEKIPLYCIVSVALQIVLTFAFVDFVNCMGRRCSGCNSGRLIVSSSPQVCLILVIAIALGLLFGIVFGVYDVEDDSGWLQWRKDRRLTFPMGMVGGSLTSWGVYLCPRKTHRKPRKEQEGFVKMHLNASL